ncbi:uncharacterized protein LOC114571311 [Perca flavescens]|uniref:uncharacterized protein LOC114571311 n=1 Tax=Perca flavescens TaxID=8167 RepID=UPI00106E5F93|nr:uncharacterized protein LOC114571311 [Perca flavescens]
MAVRKTQLDCVFEESGSDSSGSELCSHTGLDPDYKLPLNASSSSDDEDLKSPGKAKKLSRKEEFKGTDTSSSEDGDPQVGKITIGKKKNTKTYAKIQNKEQKRTKKDKVTVTGTVKTCTKREDNKRAPSKFQLVVSAVNRLTEFSPCKKEYGKLSTAVKIGFCLKGAAEVQIGQALMHDDDQAEKKAKKFLEPLERNWRNNVSVSAHQTIQEKRWNKRGHPLTKNVIVLRDHLRMVEDKARGELRQQLSLTAYKTLNETVLAQVIAFNKRREGEASRLTLEAYKKGSTNPINEAIYVTLSPLEKELSKRLTLIEVTGKRGERPGVMTFYIRGCDCLQKYAEKSGAENPDLLRSTKLRKQVATLCQLLDLSASTFKGKNLDTIDPSVCGKCPTSTSESVPQRERKQVNEVDEDGGSDFFSPKRRLEPLSKDGSSGVDDQSPGKSLVLRPSQKKKRCKKSKTVEAMDGDSDLFSPKGDWSPSVRMGVQV